MRRYATILLVGLLLVGVPMAGCLGDAPPDDGGPSAPGGGGGGGGGGGTGGGGSGGGGTGGADGNGSAEVRAQTDSWSGPVAVRVAGMDLQYDISVDFTVNANDTAVLIEAELMAAVQVGSGINVHICDAAADCPASANQTLSGSAPIRETLDASTLGPGDYTALVTIDDPDVVVQGSGQLGVSVFPTMQPPDDYTAFESE